MNIRKYIFALASFSFLLNNNTMLAMERVKSCKDLCSHFNCSNVEFDKEYYEIFSLVPEQDKDSSEDVNKVKELLNKLPYLQERDLEYDECRDGYKKNNKSTLNGIKTILKDSSFDDSICSAIVKNIVERFGFSGVFNEMLFDMLPYEYKAKFILMLFKNPYSLSSNIHDWQQYTIEKFQRSTLEYVERYKDFQGMIKQEIVNKFINYKEFDEPLFDILPENLKRKLIDTIKKIEKDQKDQEINENNKIIEDLRILKYSNDSIISMSANQLLKKFKKNEYVLSEDDIKQAQYIIDMSNKK